MTRRLDLGPQPVHGSEAMAALGARLALQLRAGDVLALVGDLGAGKTTLVRGLCAALGVPEDAVASPTFALCNVYVSHDLQIAHMDLYRLESPDDLAAAGLDEWLGAPDALCVIEWPEVARRDLPRETLWLHIAMVPDGRLVEQTHLT